MNNTEIPDDAVVILSGARPYVLTIVTESTVEERVALDLTPELLDRVNVQAI